MCRRDRSRGALNLGLALKGMMLYMGVSKAIELSLIHILDEKELIYEFNPALRVAENKDGVQAMLDYLSFKLSLIHIWRL